MASIKCPNCQHLISGVSVRQTIKCPKCGNAMKLSGGASQSTATTTTNSVQGKKKSQPIHLQHGNLYQEYYQWFCSYWFLFNRAPQDLEMR